MPIILTVQLPSRNTSSVSELEPLRVFIAAVGIASKTLPPDVLHTVTLIDPAPDRVNWFNTDQLAQTAPDLPDYCQADSRSSVSSKTSTKAVV